MRTLLINHIRRMGQINKVNLFKINNPKEFFLLLFEKLVLICVIIAIAPSTNRIIIRDLAPAVPIFFTESKLNASKPSVICYFHKYLYIAC